MPCEHEELIGRVVVAGVVAELEVDDPAGISCVRESLRDFLTDAEPGFHLRLEDCSWPAVEEDLPGSAADFIQQGSLLVMKSDTGSATFDHQRHSGVLIQARHPDLLKGFLTAISLEYLFQNGGLVLHAAGLQTVRGAVVFFGPSGSGKTTLAQRMRKENGGAIISDEAVALRPATGGGYLAEGLPWRGCRLSAPLLGLFHLSQAPRLTFQRLGSREFVRALIPNIYLTEPGARQVGQCLEIAEALWRQVPCFRMEYSLSDAFLLHALELLSTGPCRRDFYEPLECPVEES